MLRPTARTATTCVENFPTSDNSQYDDIAEDFISQRPQRNIYVISARIVLKNSRQLSFKDEYDVQEELEEF